MKTRETVSLRLASLAVVSVISLVGSPSLAEAKTVIHEQFSEPVDETVTDICPFPVHLTGQVSASVQATREPNGGNFIRVIFHFENNFVLSANGNVVTERDRYNEFDIDFAGDVPPGAPTKIVLTGMFNQSTLPNGKKVLIEAGRIVEDVTTNNVIFQVGHVRASGDIAELCAALGA